MSRFALALLFAVAVVAAPRAQDSIAGAWTLNVNSPQGALDVSCTFKQDGDKISGTLTGPQGDVEIAGTYKEKKLALAFTVQTPQGNLDIKINADVTGEEMKGQIDLGGMGQADFTGKKK
jgi:hypothetical protein